MSRESKNYRNGKVPPLQEVYEGYAFCFDTADKIGAVYKPHRIFPNDNTPRTFINCNLVNAIPAPTATLINCNTSIIERNLPTGEMDSKGNPVFECIVHGRTNPTNFGKDVNLNKKRLRQ